MIQIIAHRGYSTRYRENSPQAWQGAVDAGADFVEIDVRFTADGEAVCAHDADLARLAGRPERIADLPYATVEPLEAGGQPLTPRLVDAFATIPSSTGLLLDVKDESPHALAALDVLVRSANRQIVLGLHDANSVTAMKARGHDAILALTPQPAQSASFIAAGCSLLRLWETDVTHEWLAEAADRHVPVWITVGGRGTNRMTGDIDAASLTVLAELGVSGVLVNDPAATRSGLQEFFQMKANRKNP